MLYLFIIGEMQWVDCDTKHPILCMNQEPLLNLNMNLSKTSSRLVLHHKEQCPQSNSPFYLVVDLYVTHTVLQNETKEPLVEHLLVSLHECESRAPVAYYRLSSLPLVKMNATGMIFKTDKADMIPIHQRDHIKGYMTMDLMVQVQDLKTQSYNQHVEDDFPFLTLSEHTDKHLFSRYSLHGSCLVQFTDPDFPILSTESIQHHSLTWDSMHKHIQATLKTPPNLDMENIVSQWLK
jgi:hypothetical protein